MQFDELKDPVLQEKLKTCQSAEELVALAAESGVELTDEELDGIAGGAFWDCDANYCDGYICQKVNGR